ncbi:MAG: hypothetical protein ACLU4J_27205 [Butyricimonas paravirosa]
MEWNRVGSVICLLGGIILVFGGVYMILTGQTSGDILRVNGNVSMARWMGTGCCSWEEECLQLLLFVI